MCKLLLALNIENPRIYLAGKVIVVAASGRDLRNFLNAASYPPYISPKDVEKLSKTVAVSVTDRGNYIEVAATDLPTLDAALEMASVLAARLEDYMPNAVHGVDARVVYRASEDGGLETRYTVSVRIHKKASELAKTIKEVLKEVAESLELSPVECEDSKQ